VSAAGPRRGYTLDWHGDKLLAQVEAGARRNVETACVYLVGQIKQELSKPGTGRLYKRTKGKKGTKAAKYHRASTAGHRPAPDFDRLRASITYAVSGGRQMKPVANKKGESSDGVERPAATRDQVTGVVGSNVPYAIYLELGTKLMRWRPFLRTGLLKHKAEIARLLGRAVPLK